MPAGFVDIHHHLLYETDDGPTSFEQSVQMLHCAADQGVACIAATPHILAGHYKFDPEEHRRKLEKLREYIETHNMGIELCTGAELLYTAALPTFLEEKRLPTLGNSWHILVEFNPNTHFDTIHKAAVTIGNTGHSMVLAHAERYYCLRRNDRAAHLRDRLHVKLQLNSDAVIAAHRLFGDRWIRRMLRENAIDFIASDAHNTTARPCTLGDCAALIAREYGAQQAQRICIDAPCALLNEKNRRNPTKSAEENCL